MSTVGQVGATLDVQHAFPRRLDEFGVVRLSCSWKGESVSCRLSGTRFGTRLVSGPRWWPGCVRSGMKDARDP